MLKQPQNAPYQNWQAKGRGNFCKCKNIPPEHTASNYFWTHSNVRGGSKRNSNCVSSVGSRKLQIAEHTMFQSPPQRPRSRFLAGRAARAAGRLLLEKHRAGTAPRQGQCPLHRQVTAVLDAPEKIGQRATPMLSLRHRARSALPGPERHQRSCFVSSIVSVSTFQSKRSGSVPSAVEATCLSANTGKKKTPPDRAAQGRMN